MNYEDLTKRIKKAEKKRDKTYSASQEHTWWNGYITALNDVRNDINTGVNNVRS